MTVGDLSARMSAAELDEWVAFYRLEPFGEWRADYRAGIVASTVFNINRGKDVEARNPADFMPLIERERPEPTAPDPETVRRKMLAWLPPRAAV